MVSDGYYNSRAETTPTPTSEPPRRQRRLQLSPLRLRNNNYKSSLTQTCAHHRRLLLCFPSAFLLQLFISHVFLHFYFLSPHRDVSPTIHSSTFNLPPSTLHQSPHPRRHDAPNPTTFHLSDQRFPPPLDGQEHRRAARANASQPAERLQLDRGVEPTTFPMAMVTTEPCALEAAACRVVDMDRKAITPPQYIHDSFPHHTNDYFSFHLHYFLPSSLHFRLFLSNSSPFPDLVDLDEA